MFSVGFVLRNNRKSCLFIAESSHIEWQKGHIGELNDTEERRPDMSVAVAVECGGASDQHEVIYCTEG